MFVNVCNTGLTRVSFFIGAGYVQGMSDLLSPILFVTQNEVESFWCLTGFMELVVSKNMFFLFCYCLSQTRDLLLRHARAFKAVTLYLSRFLLRMKNN